MNALDWRALKQQSSTEESLAFPTFQRIRLLFQVQLFQNAEPVTRVDYSGQRT